MIQDQVPLIKPKDFLQTDDDLIFAVVAHDTEDNRVLSFLRYIKSETTGKWKKLNTDQANSYLQRSHPHYLYHFSHIDADLHGVPFEKIKKLHQPSVKFREIMGSQIRNKLQSRLVEFVDLLITHNIPLDKLGITGSFLIGAENENSDIDLVIYDRSTFYQVQKLIQKLIDNTELTVPDEKFWNDAYDRRSCSLTIDEYIRHETPKYNKALYKGVKVDLSLVVDKIETGRNTFIKKGKITITADVIDDYYAFDTPSSYSINHPEYKQVICFTPTYAGQAKKGDTVEISGSIEESEDGCIKRIIIGSSREAPGEYIKVIGNV